ncbi:hypothetical protein ABK040_011237 [Willaertia magna]
MGNLIQLNEIFKKQENEFKLQCQQDLQNYKNLIENLNLQKDTNLNTLQQAYLNDLEKLKKIKKLNSLKNKELQILQRKIDEIPSRTELSQYERRFTELYFTIVFKLDENKKYFIIYNTLNNNFTYLEQELNLLNQITEIFQKSVNFNSDKKYKQWMLTSVNQKLEVVKVNLNNFQNKMKDNLLKRDTLQKEHDELINIQRQYFRAIKEFQNEMIKNDELKKLLQQF